MLDANNLEDREKMMDYYRTSDMLNLLQFFPQISPVKDLTIIENIEDYYKNKGIIDKLPYNRVDTLKGRTPILGIENAGLNCEEEFIKTFAEVKQKDKLGVIVLFDISSFPSQRYERYAGISVAVDLGKEVMVEAVSKGFDGREVSKSICTHERYYIPWYDLRKVCVGNFKEYQTFQISKEQYKVTRVERINFLKSVGLNPDIVSNYIPEDYQEVPNFIWLSVIRGILKQLEKNEDILASYGHTSFAISGHTEENNFAPWQMFDKSRYTLVKRYNNKRR